MLGGVAVGAGVSRARAGARAALLSVERGSLLRGSELRASVVRASVLRGALPPRLLLPLPADGRVLVLPLLLPLLLLAKHPQCNKIQHSPMLFYKKYIGIFILFLWLFYL